MTINQHYYTIDSTDDISRALSEARREGYELTDSNAVFSIYGTAGDSILIDDSLAGLHVVALGPAPVVVSGAETLVQVEGSAVAYATEGSRVDAYDFATVYAYDRAMVTVGMESSAYVASDDVCVDAYGDSKVYLPAYPSAGAFAEVDLHSDYATLQVAGKKPYRRVDEPEAA
jgi:hypothetical protein